MTNLGKEASKVSFYLQRLTDEAIIADVQDAVLRKDKASFARICEKIKIPNKYITILTALALTATPTQPSWP